MGTYSTREVLNATAVGVHHPALRLHELDLKDSLSGEDLPMTSGLENGHQEPFVITTNLLPSSGKSTICKMIIDQLCDQCIVVVTQESFYYGLPNKESLCVHDYNFDHLDAFDMDLLLSCMETLKHGKVVDIPSYDFKTHRSVSCARKVILY
uniref:Phosphoribulokinase/uridine kinase domain-containing protein n=1 Tax=Triticum urartu TaxID=4572 RepID=A0A8R7QY09_TRIUA